MTDKRLASSKLIAAIRENNFSDVISAINEGANIEEADMHGFTGLPLRIACFQGDIEIVRALLQRGADVNAMADDGPGAPLRLARRGGHPEIAELLLQEGATAQSAEEIAMVPLSRMSHTQPITNAVISPVTDEAPVDNIIEFTSPPPAELIEEVDLTACYGLDTNLLTLDLLRLEEQPEEAKPPPAKAGGFWTSKR